MDRITAAQQALLDPRRFVRVCQILREDEGVGFLDPTYAQRMVLDAMVNHRWIMIGKYRQAKQTTLAVMWLLGQVMFTRGVKGALVAEKHETAEMAFERLQFAYRGIPSKFRVGSKSGGVRHIEFDHGGGIQTLTGAGRAPAVGRSIDRLVLTEYGEWPHQREAAAHLFPSINKRPNARVVLESTFGRAGSQHERMWRSALEGKGRFHAVFLEWWRDSSCLLPVPADFIPTNEELRYLEQHEGMTNGHLMFRRRSLDTEFAGDTRLFRSKYPSDPYDGWLGSLDPVMPEDALRQLLTEAVADPEEGDWGSNELQPPRPNGVYLITADPAGYGAKGDPSALTVWDAISREEVANWSGREDPGKFADRLCRVQARYGNCLLAVESNAAHCIATLRSYGTQRLLWTDKSHPGWYNTRKRLQEAEARTIQLLREDDLRIRSRATLHQMLDYDGRARDSKSNEGHHFDRAVTVVMAGDILSRRAFTPITLAAQGESTPAGYVSIRDLDNYGREEEAALVSPFIPPPKR